MLLVSPQHKTSMARESRSKLSNVVKSRSAPSLLGGFSSPRQEQEPPSNRFIELGDIALGNSRRHASQDNFEVQEEALPEVPRVAAVVERKAPRSAKKSKARPVVRTEPARVPRIMVGARPAPLTRPKPPKPPVGRPQLPLPPKSVLPKPPKVNRPKPVIGRLGSVKPRTQR